MIQFDDMGGSTTSGSPILLEISLYLLGATKIVPPCGWFSPRLFQDIELEHTPKQPLPTGYNGIPFIVGDRGIAERVCDIGVCCNFLGFAGNKKDIRNHRYTHPDGTYMYIYR